MRFTTTINNVKALEWGLNIQQAYLFAWMYELPSWADKVIIGTDVYYFASKNKAVEDMPLLGYQIDTMYRCYVQLQKAGLILIKKIDGKDYISLTEKAKTYNSYESDNSEKNPSKTPSNSDLNPTYYNISNITNNTVEDIKSTRENFENRKVEFGKKLEPFSKQYPRNMLNDFYKYWTEPNKSGTKFKMELERTFDIARRLETWSRNEMKFGVKQPTNEPITDKRTRL